MATISIELPALLQAYVDGQAVLAMEAGTMNEALTKIFERYPLLQRHLVDEAGTRRPHVLFFLNDADTRWLDSLDHPLADGDCLAILQAVSGG